MAGFIVLFLVTCGGRLTVHNVQRAAAMMEEQYIMSGRQPNGGDNDRANEVEDGRVDAPQTSVTWPSCLSMALPRNFLTRSSV